MARKLPRAGFARESHISKSVRPIKDAETDTTDLNSRDRSILDSKVSILRSPMRHCLFADIVAFTTLSNKRQSDIREQYQIDCGSFMKELPSNQLLKRNYDGLVAVFNNPLDTLKSAIFIAEWLHNRELCVRLGLSSGDAKFTKSSIYNDVDAEGPAMVQASRLHEKRTRIYQNDGTTRIMIDGSRILADTNFWNSLNRPYNLPWMGIPVRGKISGLNQLLDLIWIVKI